MQPKWQVSDFWDFSVTYYAQHKDALLALQDDWGANVNMLLLCLYVQQKGYKLCRDGLKQLLEAIAASQIALEAHRERRRAGKGTGSYRQLLDEELALEKYQQQIMVDQLAGLVLVAGDPSALDNLTLYEGALALTPTTITKVIKPVYSR